MTEFKYCVHCENEPAVCFDTEVDAMKFARDCTDTCSCVKVEKSEIDEDGEILNNEVIWAADCDDVIEKETISDNEFDTAGESGAGKNMPPYICVYMWKRVADDATITSDSIGLRPGLQNSGNLGNITIKPPFNGSGINSDKI